MSEQKSDLYDTLLSKTINFVWNVECNTDCYDVCERLMEREKTHKPHVSNLKDPDEEIKFIPDHIRQSNLRRELDGIPRAGQ